jgi:hypothetical protein
MAQFEAYVTQYEAVLYRVRIEAASENSALLQLNERLDRSGTDGFEKLNSTVTELEINAMEESPMA